MKKKELLYIIGLLTLPLILIGCRSKATASPTANPELIYTAAAQTADARLTQIFASTPSATPVTPSPTVDLVKTMAAQTAAALLTQSVGLTPSPTRTAGTTPVPPGPSGDRAIFVADVSIPDGQVIAPGAAFTKIWKIQNAGSSTWTTSYSLAFVSGEKMGTISSVSLPQSVAPGAQIDISVDLVAPTTPGSYQGYWKMKNSAGQFFNDSVYVLITVGAGGATPTAGTPGVTPVSTSTGIPSNPVTSLTMAVDQGTYQGPCPHSFFFTATFTLNQAATLTYVLEAGSDTPGFTFVLPGAQTRTFDAGTYSIPSELTFISSGSGWVRLHISSPVDMASNQAAFSLTCTP
ncbi:MAG: hypothetical protein C3F13_10990 [Anaerolineales bacterium]|nr:hypothetical protein [Anaerolineae bacterium]PWB52826.1 MAG: hypothetical protein C3F13_10990 [Anaerolineales bacterium]